MDWMFTRDAALAAGEPLAMMDGRLITEMRAGLAYRRRWSQLD